MATLHSPLTGPQRRLLDEWLGPWQLIEDMSWQLQGITVLQLRTPAGEVVAKASGTGHHIDREIRAYRQMTAPLAGRTPVLLHADAAAHLLVASYLPGRLVEGGPGERDPELFGQAGALLALLHQPRQRNNGYDGAVLHKIEDFAARAAGLIPAAELAAVRQLASAHRPAPRLLYATHGDYQPRNWLVHAGRLAVIDYGRAGYRPWVADLVRLEHSWFSGDDGLCAAFYAGYGRRPEEEPDAWRLDNLLQSLGTVVWAHDAGDAAFEAEGRRMVGRVLERWA